MPGGLQIAFHLRGWALALLLSDRDSLVKAGLFHFGDLQREEEEKEAESQVQEL